MFKFKIIQKCFQDASNLDGNDADFYLEQNDWNDKDYYVLYHLHATKRLTKDKNIHLGSFRIMRKGQEKQQKYLLASIFRDTVFEELPEDFVSVCFEKDVYDWLHHMPVAERQSFAKQLHLIYDRESPYYSMVANDGCFVDGMLRDTTMDNYIFQMARVWIDDEERRYNLRKESFRIKYNDCDDDIYLNFSCVLDDDNYILPNGTVAFIGENSCGKSTALYKLAKLMYLYPTEREDEDIINGCGKIFPNDLGVERLILVSYSPFDNFVMPQEINIGLKKPNVNTDPHRFIYCGIRNIDAENEEKQSGKRMLSKGDYSKDRQPSTFIKTQTDLAEDFASVMCKLDGDRELCKLWAEVYDDAKNLHPLLSTHLLTLGQMDSHEDFKQYFMSLSTGYKYVLHSLAYIIVYLVDGSLVLFDEPENHIHPPLLSFMMMQYRKMLIKRGSVMLISTHSPVIIQEMFADNVLKVSRISDKIHVANPTTETYGSTFSEINSEVFGLTTDIIQYFNAFDYLYESWGMDSCDNADIMLKVFEDKLKRPVSPQMISYLVDKFYENNPDKD